MNPDKNTVDTTEVNDLTTPETRRKAVVKEVISWVKVVVFGFLTALIIGQFIIVNAQVPTGSMLDTIQEHSRIVAFRLSYVFSEPERFDVVVFKYPDDEKEWYVKRIIGLPGDKIDIRSGKVYVNDSLEPLDDSFVREAPYGNFGPYIVPEGCYFMMGDNRNNSEDSRYWHNTYVEKSKILGKVIFSYYPEIKTIK